MRLEKKSDAPPGECVKPMPRAGTTVLFVGNVVPLRGALIVGHMQCANAMPNSTGGR